MDTNLIDMNKLEDLNVEDHTVQKNLFGTVVRVALDQFDASGVSSLDLTLVDPSLKGFQDGYTDGAGYGYLVPFGGSTKHGKLVCCSTARSKPPCRPQRMLSAPLAAAGAP